MNNDARIHQCLKETYRIDTRIAAGGMGTVYAGTQLNLNRKVAIKVLHERLVADGSMRARFHKEASALAALNHPNVVHVIDTGECSDGSPFLVMEYLDGPPLTKWIEQNGPAPAQVIFEIMKDIADGVDAIHERCLLHRDIKPDNIIMVADLPTPSPKLIDFGLVRDSEIEGEHHTQAGMLLGTPGFVAPEQLWSQDDLDHRADQYAMGGILYFLATGEPPYRGATPQAVVTKQLSEEPAAIDFDRCHCPPAIEAVIKRAMAVERDNRFPSNSDFLCALKEAIGTTSAFRASHCVAPVPDTRPTSISMQLSSDDPPAHPKVRLPSSLPLMTASIVLIAGLFIFWGGPTEVHQAATPPQPIGTDLVPSQCPTRSTLKNNNFESTCVMADGTPNGPSITMFEGGQIKIQQNYNAGRLDGQWTRWFKNGRRMSSGEWSNGVKDGRWQSWSTTGQLQSESQYLGGRLDGRTTKWFPSGQVMEESTYVQGDLDGRYVQWFENGQPKTEGQYRLGKKDGRWQTYRRDGSLVDVKTYRNGDIIGPATTKP